MPVLVNYGRPPDGSELPVNSSDQLLYLPLHQFVMQYADARRDNHQNQDQLSAIFGIRIKQELKTLQAVQNAFGVVEPVYREHGAETGKALLQLLPFQLRFRRNAGLKELLEIDSHRIRFYL